MARSTSSPVAIPGTRPTLVPGRPVALNLLISVRPWQWTKNLLVFAGLLFGHRLLEWPAVANAMVAFVVFCALSGVVYLMNDVMDRESDRSHPLKAQRPIASGALSVGTAVAAAIAIGAAALALPSALGWPFFAAAIGYVALQALYSGPLKQIVIIDVLTLSGGFVLRAVAGAVAVRVEISHWLLVCTVLLALFIALAKRRHEIVLLAGDAPAHRPSLAQPRAYL